jgi:uncharacterized protein (TIGR03000 family)
MTKRWFTAAAVVGLAASVMLLFPTESQAQRRGGWGGARGVNVGVGPGGVGVGVGRGYGWGGYGYGSPYGNGYGLGGYGYGMGGYGLGGYGRGLYGYSSPGYYDSGYSYDTYTSPSYASVPTYTDYQSFYPPQEYGNQQQAGNAAHLMIQVPDPNAQVWLEGQQMNQQGTTRQFYSPPLEPNRDYSYTVRARWMENGQPKEQTKEVDVRAGQQASVRFGNQGQNIDMDLNRDLNRDRELNRIQNRGTTKTPDRLPPPPPANPDKTNRIDK